MINQVDIFNKSLNVSGLIITKIDGTAKGGALISVANKYEIPIYFVGLGEKTPEEAQAWGHEELQKMGDKARR